MSRIDELKKQYPELNITLFDLLNRMDPTKTYKYLPLLCKFFGERFNIHKQWDLELKDRALEAKRDLRESLNKRGVSISNETLSEQYTLYQFTEFYNTELFQTMKEFIERMEKNQIPNKDVTSYTDLDSMRYAISLASLKEMDKELESQVIKEYEDNTWLIVRPLTFQASAKYGASTRWCTTYQKEKQYFEKYWRRGILVYFINKVTGYKFAGFKALDGDTELSFWNAADSRVDYLDVNADDYLFPIVRNILKSKKTNKDFCSNELVKSVEKECKLHELKMLVEEPMVEVRDQGYVEERVYNERPLQNLELNLRELRNINVEEEVVTEREWSYDEGPTQAG